MSRNRIGIKRYKNGWQAIVRLHQGPGGLKHKSFDIDTTFATMRKWREDQVDAYQKRTRTVTKGGLEDAIADYVAQRAAMPTIEQVTAHLALWAEALGRDRDPLSIEPGEINRVMTVWEQTPTNQPDPLIKGRRGCPSAPSGLEPATIKKRRGTLRRFFNVMYPKHVNPVKGSLCPAVPDEPDARGIAVADALAVIAAMPDWRYPKKGIKVPCLAKRRALCFLWSGLPPHLLMQIRPGHLQLDAAVPGVHTARRKKGKGVEARFIELCEQAVAAYRELVAANGLGPFSPGPLNVAVKRAGRRAGVALPPDFHAYDLRHSFGAALAFSGADEATIARLMVHAEGSTVGRRYTRLAHQAVNVKAVAALGVHYADAGKLHQQNADSKYTPQGPAGQQVSPQTAARSAGASTVSSEKFPRKVPPIRKRA